MTLSLFNSAPSLAHVTHDQTIRVNENATSAIYAHATDPNGDTLTCSIIRDADTARFTIAPVTGMLRLIPPPDLQGQHSAIATDDIYGVSIRVSDGRGGVHDKSIFVEVVDVQKATGVVDGDVTAQNMGLCFGERFCDANTPSNGGTDTIVGGETGEVLGDRLDARPLASPPGTATFSELERVQGPADGVVNGTTGDDVIPVGFADPQGDQIDRTDGLDGVIDAGAGSNTVTAGQAKTRSLPEPAMTPCRAGSAMTASPAATAMTACAAMKATTP